MLSYAFTTLNQGGYEDVATEEFENIHNLFAAILAKGIGKQLKQGLYREYLNRKDDITVVRGKIDMPGTIRNRLSRKQVLTCEYDELSENNLFNQILKTTVMLLLRHARVDQEHKNDLKKEMLFFSNVDTIDPTAIRWAAIRFQRNNSTYRMLISLCQLILDGMLLTTDSGEFKLASFVDEQRMNRLYEKFILEYYAKECPWVTATASQIPWALDDGVGPMLPIMQSDIMLTRGSEVLIIDAKYYTHTTQKQYDIHKIHSSNLYQILGQFTRNYTQTVKRAADNKRRYAPGWVHSTCLLRGFPKGAAPHLAHDFAEQSVVCYTLCRRCPENTVAAGEGKGI